MKLVVAIIKTFKLDNVKDAVSKAGIKTTTAYEVMGFGRQKGHIETYRGAGHEVRFFPKIKVEMAVPDEKLDEIIDLIRRAAHTGEIGDGKIFVYPLDEVIRIRTGEKGEDAV